MRRGHWYAVAALGLLVAAGVVAWRTWLRTSAGPFDPVSAVIALAGLAVGVVSVRLAVRAQQQADTDVAAVAKRLAAVIWAEETEARRQLLGGQDRTIDVQFSFRTAMAHDAVGASTRGTLTNVVSYYRELRPQRMVITGVAGSGKTVMAVELMLGLLNGRPEDAPVPVRVSAALLDTSRPPGSAVQDWLVGQLMQTYGLPRTAARQVVAARMVLPVIDGLDEMDAIEQPGYASRAGQAIRACNAYLDGGQKSAIVLTCRLGQYEALEQAREWVHDAARVQLHPVGFSPARRFLTHRAIDPDRWQPVLDSMRNSGNRPLAKALSTPWRLTLAATVYEQRDPHTGTYLHDPAELTAPSFDSEDKVCDHLLGLYVPAIVAVHGSHYPAPRVNQWLGVLAGYLDANTPSAPRPARVINGQTLSGTDLVLHELWPLAGPRLPRALLSGLIAVIWLGFAVWAFGYATVSGPERGAAIAVAATLMILLAILTVGPTWVSRSPPLVGFRQLRSGPGPRRLVAWVGGGLAIGLMLGFLGRLHGRSVATFAYVLVAGLALGLAAGLTDSRQPNPRRYTVTAPAEIVWANLVYGLVAGLVAGPAVGLATQSATGLVAGLMSGLMIGLVGWRYVALLMCTRRWTSHWLPWRLGSFLHWCYDAGLLRVAGIGYQFRHRELQDYLARNPQPHDATM